METNKQSINVVIPPMAFTPIMARETFSNLVGISEDTLEGLIRKGYVPTIRLQNADSHSKRSFVNITALIKDTLKAV